MYTRNSNRFSTRFSRQLGTIALGAALITGGAGTAIAQCLGAAANTTLVVGNANGVPGETGIVIPVTTTNTVELGSSDTTFTFDPLVAQATSAASSTLSNFTFGINNTLGYVNTASATGTSDCIMGGSVLFSVTLDIQPVPGAPTSVLSVFDNDGMPPEDLAGPVPPIPPASIQYNVTNGLLVVGTHTPTATPTATVTATQTETRTRTATRTATETPIPPPTCNAAPFAGCSAATGAKLIIANSNDLTKNKLKWQWKVGPEVMFADLGDPTTTNGYTLCIYDNALTPLAEYSVPGGGLCGTKPCWTGGGLNAFKYKNSAATSDGIRKIQLRSGSTGFGRFKITGKGANLPNPTLPLTAPVVVQLVNNDGFCWESTFPLSNIKNRTSAGSVRMTGKLP